MKLADIAKLAQNATGATPIGLAAEAVSQLARIADAVQTIATHMTRDDNPMHTDVCASCMDVGTVLCSVHGTPGYHHG